MAENAPSELRVFPEEEQALSFGCPSVLRGRWSRGKGQLDEREREALAGAVSQAHQRTSLSVRKPHTR